MSWLKKSCLAIVAVQCLAIAPVAKADSEVSNFISGAGTTIFLLTGITLPLFTDGKNGVQHSLRTADSFLTTSLITSGLKEITNVKRPDSNARDSFPSGHASTAFAVATMQSHYHPDYAWVWYSGAALIGYSRIDLNRHRVTEVLAGAALGYLIGRVELGRKHGLIFFPFIDRDREGHSEVGLELISSF